MTFIAVLLRIISSFIWSLCVPTLLSFDNYILPTQYLCISQYTKIISVNNINRLVFIVGMHNGRYNVQQFNGRAERGWVPHYCGRRWMSCASSWWHTDVEHRWSASVQGNAEFVGRLVRPICFQNHFVHHTLHMPTLGLHTLSVVGNVWFSQAWPGSHLHRGIKEVTITIRRQRSLFKEYLIISFLNILVWVMRLFWYTRQQWFLSGTEYCSTW